MKDFFKIKKSLKENRPSRVNFRNEAKSNATNQKWDTKAPPLIAFLFRRSRRRLVSFNRVRSSFTGLGSSVDSLFARPAVFFPSTLIETTPGFIEIEMSSIRLIRLETMFHGWTMVGLNRVRWNTLKTHHFFCCNTVKAIGNPLEPQEVSYHPTGTCWCGLIHWLHRTGYGAGRVCWRRWRCWRRRWRWPTAGRDRTSSWWRGWNSGRCGASTGSAWASSVRSASAPACTPSCSTWGRTSQPSPSPPTSAPRSTFPSHPTPTSNHYLFFMEPALLLAFSLWPIFDDRCSIVCPEERSAGAVPVTVWSIMSKVRLEAMMWGAGTALGELPPYFVVRILLLFVCWVSRPHSDLLGQNVEVPQLESLVLHSGGGHLFCQQLSVQVGLSSPGTPALEKCSP